MKESLTLLRNVIKLVLEARHNKQTVSHGVSLKLDTKSDPEWNILKTEAGRPVARQAKRSIRRFTQASMA